MGRFGQVAGVLLLCVGFGLGAWNAPYYMLDWGSTLVTAGAVLGSTGLICLLVGTALVRLGRLGEDVLTLQAAVAVLGDRGEAQPWSGPEADGRAAVEEPAFEPVVPIPAGDRDGSHGRREPASSWPEAPLIARREAEGPEPVPAEPSRPVAMAVSGAAAGAIAGSLAVAAQGILTSLGPAREPGAQAGEPAQSGPDAPAGGEAVAANGDEKASSLTDQDRSALDDLLTDLGLYAPAEDTLIEDAETAQGAMAAADGGPADELAKEDLGSEELGPEEPGSEGLDAREALAAEDLAADPPAGWRLDDARHSGEPDIFDERSDIDVASFETLEDNPTAREPDEDRAPYGQAREHEHEHGLAALDAAPAADEADLAQPPLRDDLFDRVNEAVRNLQRAQHAEPDPHAADHGEDESALEPSALPTSEPPLSPEAGAGAAGGFPVPDEAPAAPFGAEPDHADGGEGVADDIMADDVEPEPASPAAPLASDEGVIAAYTVGDSAYAMLADGRIKVTTPEEQHIFQSMDELKAFMAARRAAG